MNHQPTLDALTGVRYWLEAHPELPSPSVYISADGRPGADVILTWHTSDQHVALAVLRAFDGWKHEQVSRTGYYSTTVDGVMLSVYHASAGQFPNLLDALAEVA